MTATDVTMTFNTNILGKGTVVCPNLSFKPLNPEPGPTLLDFLSVVSNPYAQSPCSYANISAGVSYILGHLEEIGYYIKFVCPLWTACEPQVYDYNVSLQHWHPYINAQKVLTPINATPINSHNKIEWIFENNV